MTEIEDAKVRKNEILSNRDKAQRPPGQGLDGRGVQVDEYKDNPANHHPSGDDDVESDVKATANRRSRQPRPTS